MKPPPAAARWLLTCLAPSTPDSVLGDLQEEYEAGRSTAWYWRQVLGASVAAAGRQITRHPILAVRATFVGWAFLWVFFTYCLQFLLSPHEWLFVRGIADIRSWWPTVPRLVVLHIITPLACAAAGWIVARLHKREMVLIFLVTVLAWNLMGIIHAVSQGWVGEGFLIALVWNFVVIPVSILLGGITARMKAVE